MTRLLPEYEEYVYEDLLQALYDKQCMEEAIEDCRTCISHRAEILFTDNNLFIIAVHYATESEEDNREISR